MTLTPAVFDLFDVLADLEMMFRLRAEAKGLRFEVLVESPCEACIEADKGKIRQVLVNAVELRIPRFPDLAHTALAPLRT